MFMNDMLETIEVRMVCKHKCGHSIEFCFKKLASAYRLSTKKILINVPCCLNAFRVHSDVSWWFHHSSIPA
jgi:hypothetical protein